MLPEVAAIAEEAPDDVLEAAEAKDDPIARFVLARILSQTAAHSHLQWDTLVDGERAAGGWWGWRGRNFWTVDALAPAIGTRSWRR